MTQPATVGSHLLYTYQASDHCRKQAVGQSRPAVVVRSWGTCYNVQVLTDGVNDFDDKRLVLHLTSVQLSGCIAKGRLHYPGSPVESAPEEPAVEASPLLVDGKPYALGDLPSGADEPKPSAPEGAQSDSHDGPPSQDAPSLDVAAPAVPEAPKPKKNKGGRPKKAK